VKQLIDLSEPYKTSLSPKLRSFPDPVFPQTIYLKGKIAPQI